MGTGSTKPQAEKGPASTDSTTTQQVRRGVGKTSLGRELRLTRPRELERVRRSGRRIQTSALTVWIARGSNLQSRVAIVVALRGHSSVARNKLKRQLRHIVRTEILPNAGEPYDAIVSARSSAYLATFNTLRSLVVQAFLSES